MKPNKARPKEFEKVREGFPEILIDSDTNERIIPDLVMSIMLAYRKFIMDYNELNHPIIYQMQVHQGLYKLPNFLKALL